ncbi:hypothetical protein LCGC14_2000500 [marine sediment metagenome]|uniref:Uncharacterized protein n=1 Tax=marine sediment metagenome TaxID=412755 RepID=A0A0F9HGT9_9ZZZZ
MKRIYELEKALSASVEREDRLKGKLGEEKAEREIEKTVDDEAILGYREENKECRQILEKQLDRDKDPDDSLRDLVVVACNALYWARAKKKHFVMAKLQAENEKLKEKIKVLELAQDLTQYTKEQLQENERLKSQLQCTTADLSTKQTENETLHKKLIILRNAKCPKCDFRFKIRKLIK